MTKENKSGTNVEKRKLPQMRTDNFFQTNFVYINCNVKKVAQVNQ